MAEESSAPAKADALVIERVFDAPRELVWKAWTDAEARRRWWGPKGFTIPHCKIDARPGGRFHLCMRSPDGQEMWVTGEFREVVEPELLVSVDSPSNEEGKVLTASQIGMEGDQPFETLVTVTFEEEEGKTRMTMRHEGLPAGPMAEGAEQGWNQAFDKLAEYVSA